MRFLLGTFLMLMDHVGDLCVEHNSLLTLLPYMSLQVLTVPAHNWMQRALILVAYKSLGVCVQPFKTRVGCPQIWKGISPARPIHFPAHICHFYRVSGKPSLLRDAPPGQCLSSQADMAEQRFLVEYAKRGTAGCKKCKDKIMKGIVRIGKIVPNPFSESAGEMKEWYHVKCIFEKLERARATTKKIEDLTELEGWEELQDEDKDLINKHISGTCGLLKP